MWRRYRTEPTIIYEFDLEAFFLIFYLIELFLARSRSEKKFNILQSTIFAPFEWQMEK